MQSMTGFGSATGAVEGVEYTVEIRSVNNRYFKLLSKLPDVWSGVEAEMEQLLRSRLQRGSVNLTVRMRLPNAKAAYAVNVPALQSYMNQLKILEVEADPTLRIDLSSLLSLPGVCEPPAPEEIRQATYDGLMKMIDKALKAMLKMRQKEGRMLKTEMKGLCKTIESNLALVSKRAPKVVEDHHARLTARISELTDSGRAGIDPDVLAREVALFAERCDIAEERSRLASHLKQFSQAMDTAEPIGRKLDFIAQEMLREANTIAAKANDAEIARSVVEIKTAIDRIKEQAANVE